MSRARPMAPSNWVPAPFIQILCLAASLLALNLTPAFGQPNSPMPAPPLGPTFQQRLQAIQRAGALQNEAPEMTKFNLDFPGGPPELLGKAIEKAMGKPLNVMASKRPGIV